MSLASEELLRKIYIHRKEMGGKGIAMDMTTEDLLKKALLDTQEKVRDFMHYTRELDNVELKTFFKDAAEEEAVQARRIQQFLGDIQ